MGDAIGRGRKMSSGVQDMHDMWFAERKERIALEEALRACQQEADTQRDRADAAEAREREARDVLRPFATFDFGPGWIGHQFIERDGDTVVLCGYDADGKVTGVDVKFSDFARARALAAPLSRKEPSP